jgi:hypothetical protein
MGPEPGDWCVERLRSADDYFLAARELWREYTSLYRNPHLDYEKFENRLRSDERLFLTGAARPEASETLDEAFRNMGLSPGALVGLAGRMPPREALDRAIYARALQLRRALEGLWEARPAGELEIEEKLTRLLREARKLCDALKPPAGKTDGEE